MLRWLIILGEIICESSNWQHILRLKITILGANWQLFRLERIAKCSYFMLSTQNIKIYWFVMKIKKSLLPIWWYNRGLFLLGINMLKVFILNGLRALEAVGGFSCSLDVVSGPYFVNALWCKMGKKKERKKNMVDPILGGAPAAPPLDPPLVVQTVPYNDIRRQLLKMTFLVNEQNVSVMNIDINAISGCLDFNIFQQDECFCSKLGIQVEYAKFNLKTSLSQIWVIGQLLPFGIVRQTAVVLRLISCMMFTISPDTALNREVWTSELNAAKLW